MNCELENAWRKLNFYILRSYSSIYQEGLTELRKTCITASHRIPNWVSIFHITRSQTVVLCPIPGIMRSFHDFSYCLIYNTLKYDTAVSFILHFTQSEIIYHLPIWRFISQVYASDKESLNKTEIKNQNWSPGRFLNPRSSKNRASMQKYTLYHSILCVSCYETSQRYSVSCL